MKTILTDLLNKSDLTNAEFFRSMQLPINLIYIHLEEIVFDSEIDTNLTGKVYRILQKYYAVEIVKI